MTANIYYRIISIMWLRRGRRRRELWPILRSKNENKCKRHSLLAHVLRKKMKMESAGKRFNATLLR